MFYVSVGEFISSWGNACDNEGWEEKVINEAPVKQLLWWVEWGMQTWRCEVAVGSQGFEQQQLAEHPCVLSGRCACSLQEEEEEEAGTREEIPVGVWWKTNLKWHQKVFLQDVVQAAHENCHDTSPTSHSFSSYFTFSCTVCNISHLPANGQLRVLMSLLVSLANPDSLVIDLSLVSGFASTEFLWRYVFIYTFIFKE